jgi:PEP-CTERM motif
MRSHTGYARRFTKLAVAGCLVPLVAASNTWGAVILLRGATNGQSAEFSDKLVPLAPDGAVGNFTGTARAAVPVGSALTATNNITANSGKLVGATGTAGPATEAVGGVSAAALANWAVTAGGAGTVLLTTKGSYATVSGAAPPSGIAYVRITDPIQLDPYPGSGFSSLGGTAIDADFSLLGGAFGLQASGGGFAKIDASAGSNLPGLAYLFSLSILEQASNPSNLQVTFESNPALGLSDTSIENSILAALDPTYNPTTASYSLSTTDTYLMLDLPVPADMTTVQFSWNTFGIAGVVPEPSSMTMLGVGVLGLVGAYSRRRHGSSRPITRLGVAGDRL